MQKWKRSLLGAAGSVVLSGGMILNPMLDSMALHVFAMNESEWNNNRDDADEFDPGDTINGRIDSDDDVDYYKCVLDETGNLTFKITPEMKRYSLALYHRSDFYRSNDPIWESGKKESNGSTDVYDFDLEVGSYYLKVSGNGVTGGYKIATVFEDSDATEKEYNSDRESANPISFGQKMYGMISQTDEYDYYKFTLSNAQKVNIEVKSYVGSSKYRVYDINGKEIYGSGDKKIESGKDNIKFSNEMNLDAGTYYIAFTNTGDCGDYTGNYWIEVNGTASNYTEVEPNNELGQANSVVLGNEIRGRISDGDEYDYYKFTATADANLNVDVTSYLKECSVRLFDANGTRIKTWDMDRSNDEKSHYEGHNYDLKKGTYYICFTYRDVKYTGDYTIALSQDGQSNPGPVNPSEEKITGFVERMYSYCLSRSADPDGRTYWVNQLKTGAKTGAEVAEEFIFSFESTKREQSNEEFVKLLYLTMMDRNPEENGFRYWTDLLNSGQKTRYQVAAGFIDSDEFKGICSNYGINRGSINGDAVAPIEKFVARFYQLALERTPEQAGMYYWVARLKNHQDNGATVAEKFFFSDEMLGKNNSNEKYIELLYSVMMDRQADGNGKAYWLDKMDTNRQNYMSRREVLNGFIISDEFTGICRNFNIERGSLY